MTAEQYLELYVDMRTGTNLDSIKAFYKLADNQVNIVRSQLYGSSPKTMEGELTLKISSVQYLSSS